MCSLWQSVHRAHCKMISSHLFSFTCGVLETSCWTKCQWSIDLLDVQLISSYKHIYFTSPLLSAKFGGALLENAGLSSYYAHSSDLLFISINKTALWLWQQESRPLKKKNSEFLSSCCGSIQHLAACLFAAKQSIPVRKDPDQFHTCCVLHNWPSSFQCQNYLFCHDDNLFPVVLKCHLVACTGYGFMSSRENVSKHQI